MLKKRFHWSDLKKLVAQYEGITSREIMAVAILLEGHKVDVSKIPTREGFRSPGNVKYQLKRVLSIHEGIEQDGDCYWIPDLQK